MQKELEEIKHYVLNAPLPDIRHGIAKLIDFLNNYINQQSEVTPTGESQGEKRGRKPKTS